MKKHYINAVVELLLQGNDPDAVLMNLKKVLQQKGHDALYAEILKGVETELSLQENKERPAIFVATEKDSVTFKKEIGAELSRLDAKASDATVTVDASLIGGFLITHKGKLINRSYKQQLLSLYRSITK